MKLKIDVPHLGEAEYEEQDFPYMPMPESHFRALCHVAYAAIYAVAQVAALWLVGKIALVGVGAAFFIVLIAVLMKD